mmetsp:Transcript_13953/g.20698  ORF Transcript_13953/g.20698 Transcript_13953/m.20698 type:complete len:234 (+) Transcript_13953:348-1049(+)
MRAAYLSPVDTELASVAVSGLNLGDVGNLLSEVELNLLLGVHSLDLDQRSVVVLTAHVSLVTQNGSINVQADRLAGSLLVCSHGMCAVNGNGKRGKVSQIVRQTNIHHPCEKTMNNTTHTPTIIPSFHPTPIHRVTLLCFRLSSRVVYSFFSFGRSIEAPLTVLFHLLRSKVGRLKNSDSKAVTLYGLQRDTTPPSFTPHTHCCSCENQPSRNNLKNGSRICPRRLPQDYLQR